MKINFFTKNHFKTEHYLPVKKYFRTALFLIIIFVALLFISCSSENNGKNAENPLETPSETANTFSRYGEFRAEVTADEPMLYIISTEGANIKGLDRYEISDDYLTVFNEKFEKIYEKRGDTASYVWYDINDDGNSEKIFGIMILTADYEEIFMNTNGEIVETFGPNHKYNIAYSMYGYIERYYNYYVIYSEYGSYGLYNIATNTITIEPTYRGMCFINKEIIYVENSEKRFIIDYNGNILKVLPKDVYLDWYSNLDYDTMSLYKEPYNDKFVIMYIQKPGYEGYIYGLFNLETLEFEIELEYETFVVLNEKIIFSEKNGKYSFINFEGNTAKEFPMYDYMKFINNTLLFARIDDKSYFVDLNGNETILPEGVYSVYCDSYYEDLFILALDNEKRGIGFLNFSGNWVIKIDGIFFKPGFWYAGYYYSVDKINSNANYEFVDRRGKLLGGSWELNYYFTDLFVICFDKDNKSIDIMDNEYNMIKRIENVEHISHSGEYLIVKSVDDSNILRIINVFSNDELTVNCEIPEIITVIDNILFFRDKTKLSFLRKLNLENGEENKIILPEEYDNIIGNNKYFYARDKNLNTLACYDYEGNKVIQIPHTGQTTYDGKYKFVSNSVYTGFKDFDGNWVYKKYNFETFNYD